MIIKKERIHVSRDGIRAIRYHYEGWYLFGFIPLYVVRNGC